MPFDSLNSLFAPTVAEAVADGKPVVIGAPAVAPAPEAPVVEPAKTPDAEPKPSPLAEKIRQDREARAAKAKEHSEAQDYQRQLSEKDAQIAALQASDDPMGDPVAWARARKMTKEQQALFGQAMLYDLVPDKAPADMRIRLFEQKQAREAKARTEAEATQRNEAQAQRTAQMINQYADDVESSVATFTAGSYPESEGYFGTDTQSYVQSLLATARNLSEAANKAGQRADISPMAVAKALEKNLSERMSARDQRVAARKPIAVVVPDAGQQPDITGETASTKGLGGGGSPRPAATTDKERLERAAAVVFKTR